MPRPLPEGGNSGRRRSGESRADVLATTPSHPADLGQPMAVDMGKIGSPTGGKEDAIRRWLIASTNVPALVKALTALAGRARKAGAGEPVWSLEDPELVRRRLDGVDLLVECIPLTLAPTKAFGPARAVLDHRSGRCLVEVLGEGVAVPVEMLTRPPRCDACEKKRRRVTTWVLEVDGKTLQVGSQCLQHFLGGQAAALIAGYSLWKKAVVLADNAAASPPRQWEPIGKFLRRAEAVIRKYGWVSGQAAWDVEWETSTASRLAAGQGHPGEESTAFVTAALAWVRGLELEEEEDEEYLPSLQRACQGDVVTADTIGLAASLSTAYRRSLDYGEGADAFLQGGRRGRETWTMRFLSTRPMAGRWGTRWLTKFSGPAGEQVVWWATNPPYAGELALVVGDTVSVTARVKDWGRWRGRCQTTITRAKLMMVNAEGWDPSSRTGG